MTLDLMKAGQEGVIVGYAEDSKTVRRLMEIGLTIGKSVIFLRKAPFGDPIEIQVGNNFLSLRRFEASLIKIEEN